MTNTTSPDEMWQDRHVAAYLKVSEKTARRLRYRGSLPTVRVAGAVRVPRSAVLAYVADQTTGVQA